MVSSTKRQKTTGKNFEIRNDGVARILDFDEILALDLLNGFSDLPTF